MLVPLTQGIIRPAFKTFDPCDASIPQYLSITNRGVEIHASSEDPLLIIFSHAGVNYIHEENDTKLAWETPFSGSSPHWIYWEIDELGNIDYGYTRIEPLKGSQLPSDPQHGQHFFLTPNKTLQVWNAPRGKWEIKIRVFAASISGSSIDMGKNAQGNQMRFCENASQVGFNGEFRAGFLLYSGTDAIKDSNGKFLNTATDLISQASMFNKTKLMAEKIEGKAIQNIPKHYCVTWKGRNKQIGLASYTDVDNPAIGVSLEGSIRHQTRQFISKGYIYDPQSFAWSSPPNTKLFVGKNGELTTIAPTSHSLQQVGYIVNPYTVFIDMGDRILIDPVIKPSPTPI